MSGAIMVIIFAANAGSTNAVFRLVKSIPYGDRVIHALLFGYWIRKTRRQGAAQNQLRDRGRDAKGRKRLEGMSGNGPTCVFVGVNKDGSMPESWKNEGRRFKDAGYPVFFGPSVAPLTSLGSLIAFVRMHKCCNIYWIGHQGGDLPAPDTNIGGATTYKDGKPVRLFPLPDPPKDWKHDLRLFLRENGCKKGQCYINLCACTSNDREAVHKTWKEIAAYTGCFVCGSATKDCRIGRARGKAPGRHVIKYTKKGVFSDPWLFECEPPPGFKLPSPATPTPNRK